MDSVNFVIKIEEIMDHYLTRLQNATRKYWNKSALNTLGGESFTYSQMATLIEKFHIFFDKAGSLTL